MSQERGRPSLDLKRLYVSQTQRLLRIAAGLGLSRTDAEDAAHDSYVALLEAPRPFAADADAGRWLTRVMVNRCLLVHRRRRRSPHVLSGEPLTARVSARPIDNSESLPVRAALARLPEQELAVLVLRYFCDLNATEIGKILELPPSTVRGRLRQARLRLAEQLRRGGLSRE